MAETQLWREACVESQYQAHSLNSSFAATVFLRICQLYFSTVFLRSICQLNFSAVFPNCISLLWNPVLIWLSQFFHPCNCISELCFSTVFLNCIYHLCFCISFVCIRCNTNTPKHTNTKYKKITSLYHKENLMCCRVSIAHILSFGSHGRKVGPKVAKI